MSDELTKIESAKLHSEEVEEIIGQPPFWLIRWGITIFFGVIMLVVLLSWFIRYPDEVTTDLTLTSVNAPKSVVARTDGKLTRLLIKDNESVRKNQILGFIESTADPDQVLKLDATTDTLLHELQTDKINLISRFTPDTFDRLGELQSGFQTFNQAFLQFKAYLSSGYYSAKKKILEHDLNNLKKLHQTLLVQQAMARQDYKLAQDNFAAQETLAVKKVIAPLTLKQAQSQLLAKKTPLSQIKASIINNETAQNDKQDQLLELQKEISEQKIMFLQALNTLKSRIANWKYQYILTAPVDGQVSFVSFLQKNQTVEAGQPLFYIRPSNTTYIGLMHIPQFNLGKVEKGDNVIIKFQSYPFQEYGSVNGKIAAISTVPQKSTYLATVKLPKGLTTNYGQKLTFHEGMAATGDIITAHRRLIDKFIYRVRKTALGR